ncbi:surface-anchored protein [Saccharothrix coeruleofusca]|uniref:choice-of-anchor M domain-containing protein n=1 Tax=Saccharothrix coeruleofusca TaxID=33919 RepID=UPI001AE3DEF8|nr:choice-of-anchor M domain-containing protein [Saccharothrix coeruleofusca]MBP2337253.1 surface-anchored protein [Saccharothrix coeruleofusca]
MASLTALGLAVGSLTGTANAESAYADKQVVSEGHVDVFYVDVVDSAHTLVAHTAAGNVAPGDLVIQAKPSVASRTVSATVATLPGWKPQGQTYYLLPQTSQAGQVFGGFGYSSAVAEGTSVTYELDSVRGPGAFALWQNGEDGPNVFLASADGGPKSFTSAADHEHANWGFTEQGEYQVTVRAAVTPPGGTPTRLQPVVYTFFVGEELPQEPTPDPGTPATQLTITGLASHYHAGGVAALTAVQTPPTDEDHYHWLTRAAGETQWSFVPDAYTAKYGFVVRTSDDNREIKAVLYNRDHQLIAESAPVVIDVDDHGNDPVNGPTITATLSEQQGALVLSVAPENREVDLGALTLNPAADRYTAAGALKPITVTDTRAENPGWNASGRVRAFTTVDGQQLGGKYLGWTPTVLSASPNQTVAAGPQVASGFAAGNGLATWSQLGTAAAGAGRGTAQLGAELSLEAPADLAPGTYRALLILTAI